MARFTGTNGNDTVTPALISAGVTVSPPGSLLTGDDRIDVRGGNDTVEGDAGSDIAFLGTGNDRFIWNPGDGDDVVFGGAGTDTLEFNGSDAAELMTVTTQGHSFRFFRDVGDITVDATSVEVIEVNAGGGDDRIDASAQTRHDVDLDVVGGTGNDTFIGGAGDDAFTWNPGDGDDVFDGGNGTDTLRFNGSAAAELMTVTPLGDGFRFFRDVGDITVDIENVERIEVAAGDGNDLIDTSAVDDPALKVLVDAGGGNDTVIGGDGKDDVLGGTGNDLAELGAGDDAFTWNPGDGDDVFDGGNGTDTLRFNVSAADELMTVTPLGDGFRFFRDVGDITVDTENAERIEVDTGGGNDNLVATGADVEQMIIRTGDGNDTASGGRGDDWASLGNGHDRFIWNPGDGSDRVLGGNGTDTLEFNGSDADEEMTVNALSHGNVQLFRDVGSIDMRLRDVERIDIDAEGGDDVIDARGLGHRAIDLAVDGGDGRDIVITGAGDDRVVGGLGNDLAWMGAGDDVFFWDPGEGSDWVNGGTGRDTLDFDGSSADERMTVSSSGHVVTLFRDVGNVTMTLKHIERIDIDGGAGNDRIYGSHQALSSVDLLVNGDDGHDRIEGGAGDDRLGGDAGNDRLTGNEGADRFVFGAENANGTREHDRIHDYDQDEGDVVDIAGSVLSAVVSGNSLIVTLSGGDADRILLTGVHDVSDVTFI
jgi:Ca2+-binding RTX toxin-like protein